MNDTLKKKPFSKPIKCPNCKKPTVYSLDNEWRPFCSKPCRQIDLGAWASEGYRIESEKEDLTEEELHQPFFNPPAS